MKNIIKSILIFINIAIFSFSVNAAESLQDRFKSWGEEVFVFGDLLMIIIGVAGVILLFMGGIGLKKYADNSQQNPLMKPMIFFVAGGIMTGFTAFQGLLSESVTGEEIDKDTGRKKFDAGDL
tara:strand:+ start:282 stop:650 length:369 start_codon:yes stop_codon:yes gene_type:complete